MTQLTNLTRLTVTALLLLATSGATAENIVIGTYNIENMREHWQHKAAATQPGVPEDFIRRLQKEDDEDNWEAAEVIKSPGFNPDILVFQEGASAEQWADFNKRWLADAYATIIVFPSNSGRGQNIGVLLKPGFKVLEQRDGYHTEPDPAGNPRGDRLFARGPAFVLVQTPSGYKFWVGTNHQKSKADNDVPNTQWRNREAVRTNQIINEIAKSSGVSDVVFLGDMNDELGIQEFEMEGGGDTIANLVGQGGNELVLLTRKLATDGADTFGGYWRSNRRSFIDHIVATKSVENQVVDGPRVITDGLARVASDHYPVVVTIKADAP